MKLKIFSFLLPFFYPFVELSQIDKIQKVEFFGRDYVVTKENNTSFRIHDNICPHGGSSLSHGFLNKEKNIVCGYHGFVFDKNGSFIGINNQKKSKTVQTSSLPSCLNTLQNYQIHDNVIFVADNNVKNNLIHFPEEHQKKDYRVISGIRRIKSNYILVCENLLDMMHISFVHSFGSEFSVPKDIVFEKINEYQGRTNFSYQPSRSSISSLYSKDQPIVEVTNEYILPTNTLTRVNVNNITKTVYTRTIPVSENESILYWSVYRNFWCGNFLVDYIGDNIMRKLMEKTIDEDVKILNTVSKDENKRGKIKTKFDRTIIEFHKSMNKYVNTNTSSTK